MKRLMIYAMWMCVDDNGRQSFLYDENKLRYNLRQFSKTVETFLSEDFEVDVHILTSAKEELVLPCLNRILAIEKKLSKIFKTITFEYGSRTLDIQKSLSCGILNGDKYLFSASGKVYSVRENVTGFAEEKFAKISQETCKKYAKTHKIYEFFDFNKGYRADIVENGNSRSDAIERIKELYKKKIISCEVYIADYKNISLPLCDNSGGASFVISENKQYGIAVSNPIKELPMSFSSEGHKLVHLLKALDIVNSR